MLAIGVACLVALVVGWSKGQPFPVLFPFLLVGLIGTAVRRDSSARSVAATMTWSSAG